MDPITHIEHNDCIAVNQMLLLKGTKIFSQTTEKTDNSNGFGELLHCV